MSKLRQIVWTASKKARQKRAEIFCRNFEIDKTTRILDIGSESGENINLVLSGINVAPENVFIADIDPELIKIGHDKFGFQTVLLDGSGILPFEDESFDIVYCSSVIEHVTVSKDEIWKMKSGEDFRSAAWKGQKKFANEIRRVGQQYFVQTPTRSFPIESHTWLPFFSLLPRASQIGMMTQTNKFWIKQSLPDFNLLDDNQMQELFFDARIVYEKKLGLVKSIMAIKSLR